MQGNESYTHVILFMPVLPVYAIVFNLYKLYIARGRTAELYRNNYVEPF